MITKSTQATSRQFVATLLVVLLSWPVHAHADEVRVYAAASLPDAIGELAQDYSKTRGTEIKPVFAASSPLDQQKAEGAPARAEAHTYELQGQSSTALAVVLWTNKKRTKNR